MLVEPKLIPRLSPEQVAKSGCLAEDFDCLYDHEVVQKGVWLVGSLNFDHMIENAYDRHSRVCFNPLERTFWIEHLAAHEAREHRIDDAISWAKKELLNFERMPDDAILEALHHRDKWARLDAQDSLGGGLLVGDSGPGPYYLKPHGIVDEPKQLLELYDFDADPRRLFIYLTPLLKKHQPKSGGWRWHKWGPYYGVQAPQYEYLADEPRIEMIFIYWVMEIKE